MVSLGVIILCVTAGAILLLLMWYCRVQAVTEASVAVYGGDVPDNRTNLKTQLAPYPTEPRHPVPFADDPPQPGFKVDLDDIAFSKVTPYAPVKAAPYLTTCPTPYPPVGAAPYPSAGHSSYHTASPAPYPPTGASSYLPTGPAQYPPPGSAHSSMGAPYPHVINTSVPPLESAPAVTNTLKAGPPSYFEATGVEAGRHTVENENCSKQSRFNSNY